MGFFDSLANLGKAAVGTALLPVDIVRDVGSVVLDEEPDHTERRARKVVRNLERAVDEIDD